MALVFMLLESLNELNMAAPLAMTENVHMDTAVL